MNYSFDAAEAVAHGVDAAIILHNLRYWIAKNQANGRHLYDGRTWTYNSINAFCELFPFWTAKQIRRILEKLVEDGVILKGNYNPTGYDRTLWYAFAEESSIHGGKPHFPKRANADDQTGESNCPDGQIELQKRATHNKETNNKPNIKTNGESVPSPVNHVKNGDKYDKAYYITLKQKEKSRPLSDEEAKYVGAYESAQLQAAGITPKKMQYNHSKSADFPVSSDARLCAFFQTMREQFSQSTLSAWFLNNSRYEHCDGVITLRTGTAFQAQYIREHFGAILGGIARALNITLEILPPERLPARRDAA